MKNIIILLIILFGFQNYSFSQQFDYPIKPGSEKWNELKSTIEKIQVCQIPESLIKDIPTKELLLICLDYPLLINYTASNSPYEGLLNIIKTFNGLNELMNRDDVHKVLLRYYVSYKPSDVNLKKDKGEYTFSFCAIELLLCHKNILKRLSQVEKREVLSLIQRKYKEKEIYKKYFGFFGKMTTAFVSNKYIEELIDKAIVKNDTQELFADRMLMKDLKVVDEFLINLEKYE